MLTQSVDVVIPTYNGMPYLKDAVESVLNQTHKDLNLYVVDDGSQDNGETKRYISSLKDSRVHYLRKPNGGQASARNLGAREAKSAFVAFLDSDDVWYPEKLQKQLDAMREQLEMGMVYGLCDYINISGEITGELLSQRSGDLFDYLLAGNRITGSASMVLIRRELLEKLGYFREDLLIAEDWALWLAIAQQVPIVCVPEKLAALRVHDTSMQTNFYKMAKGLEYLYPAVVSDLQLVGRQCSIFATCCLGDAAYFYVLGRDRKAARRCLWGIIRLNPLQILKLPLERYSVYLRALVP